MIKYMMKRQFRMRKYSANENYFNVINDDAGAYLLGFISADGGVYKNKLTIAQSGDNGKLLLEWIKNNLNSTHKLSIRCGKKITHRDAHILTITSPQLISDLRGFNISENKKNNMSFPESLNSKYLKSYIRGYFDGDGCVGVYIEKKIKNNKAYYSKYLKLSFYGTFNFISKINELLSESLKGRIQKYGIHCEIIWTNKKARDFGKWLFENNSQLPDYSKNIKYLKYIEEYDNLSKLSERVSKAVIQMDMKDRKSVG
jgi:intein/homing endonuclease